MRLEKAKPEDAKEAVKWLVENIGLNDCTPRSLKNCTFYKIAGILYLPIKPVMMLESLAPNPAITGKRRLLALRRAMDDLQKFYPNVEFCYLTRGNTRLDEAARRYGFEEAPFAVYRFTGSTEGRKRAQAAKRGLAETRLRDHTGTSERENHETAGVVSSVR